MWSQAIRWFSWSRQIPVWHFYDYLLVQTLHISIIINISVLINSGEQNRIIKWLINRTKWKTFYCGTKMILFDIFKLTLNLHVNSTIIIELKKFKVESFMEFFCQFTFKIHRFGRTMVADHPGLVSWWNLCTSIVANLIGFDFRWCQTKELMLSS